MSECHNGWEGCVGPWGDDLPCFACYMDRHRALVLAERVPLPVPIDQP